MYRVLTLLKEFIFLFIKCLAILIFFGILLPEFLDWLLFYMQRSSGLYNSVLVNGIEGTGVIRNYIHLFRSFVTY